MFSNQNQHGLSIRECEQIAERNLEAATDVQRLMNDDTYAEAGVTRVDLAAIAKTYADVSMAATYLAMYKRDAISQARRGPGHPDIRGR